MCLTGVRRVVLQVFCWLQMCYVSLKAANDDVTINIASGAIKGIRVNNPDADAFLGIPFAKPPVGPLRFRKPEPVEPWQGTLDATGFARVCFQVVDRTGFSLYYGNLNSTANMSEDCLYLNVWVPVPRPTKAPVMVWIYGGLFATDTTSKDTFNGQYLAAEENVIVVTMAYRVGVFGFFYLKHESAPGNQGLYDQLMGLQWVHDNIENFGGDPDSVTLFGSGSGGLSISLHLMSPLSQDLFHRAIIQSGVPGLPVIGYQLYNATEARHLTLVYALTYLECPLYEGVEKTSDCLKTKSSAMIVNNVFFPATNQVFKPCVDGTFLTRSPQEILRNGLFKKCPILIGNVKNEGSRYVYYNARDFLKFPPKTVSKDQFVVILNRLFLFYPNYGTIPSQAFQEKLISLYMNKKNPNDTDTNLAALDSAYSDAYFVCPTNEFARAYSSHGQDVYMYQMTQRYEKSPWPKWAGVVHGDDMYFVFGSPPVPELSLTDEEKPLSMAMMTYWANFARTGNPNTPEKFNVVWPTYSKASGWSYLDLNLRYFSGADDSASTKKGFRKQECAQLNSALGGTDGAEKASVASQTFISQGAIFSCFFILTSVTLSSG